MHHYFALKSTTVQFKWMYFHYLANTKVAFFKRHFVINFVHKWVRTKNNKLAIPNYL